IAEKAQRIERYHQNLEQEIQDILTRGLKQTGYPTPTQIVIGKHGFLTGVPSTSEFVWAKPEKPEYRMFVHVSLQFNESLLGPLLLGSGRFQGFGLFRPIGGQDAHSQ
ncbi:MAG: type I-G CRISPR-associated protein Csb2, partial [bacterium]